VPVYSMATSAAPGAARSDTDAARATMNIITYAAPLTLKPTARAARSAHLA
jgi:hypothetical protein